jgi:hypothetical protein
MEEGKLGGRKEISSCLWQSVERARVMPGVQRTDVGKVTLPLFQEPGEDLPVGSSLYVYPNPEPALQKQNGPSLA